METAISLAVAVDISVAQSSGRRLFVGVQARGSRYWINSSAATRSDVGTVRSIDAAVLRAVKKAKLLPRCTAHGLRKAALRRLAEVGSTTKEIAAVSGHRTLAEIERYTKRADQGRLSRRAIDRLPDDEDEE
jgi:integrase